MKNLSFYLDGLLVGFLLRDSKPIEDGDYEYMPTRGAGHLRLGTTLRESGSAVCRLGDPEGEVTITVVAVPRVHWIRIRL
ncbi:MAG: hypothetical protein MPN21_01690 [Thermoanaerobaculia bacterium]|nr:hypothetical protein [Thermoanaerobaculia bacterium]